jgi:hypothetical protein
MNIIIWAFVALMTFTDGRVETWPASFETQEECETFRKNLPDWLDANAATIGIASATWDVACTERVIIHDPLDPQSDGHN